MTDPTRIGACRVCERAPRVLEQHSGICNGCLTRLGRRWCAMAIMARESPAFRAHVRAEIRTPAGRRLFDAMFGGPVTAVPEEDRTAERDQ